MEMQVPGLAVVPFQLRPGAGADEQRVDLAGRLVHRPGADRLEDSAQFGRHEAEAGRFLPGRRARAGAAQHRADGRSPLVRLGWRVPAAPLLSRREQVHQVHGHPDYDIRVTVEVHLTSYISVFRVVTAKDS